MCQILNKVRDVDPNNSDAVKDALATFFQNLPKHIESDFNNWLRCLEHVINRFPKYCASNRNNIESFLSNFLNLSSYYSVIEVAKCAQAVQQVKSPQDRTFSPKTSWRDQMNLLCKAAHCLIDALCPNAVDMYKTSTETQCISNSNSPMSVALNNIASIPNYDNKKSILQIRLRNIFVFIQAMLVEMYPVAKPIQPQTILNLILRSLSVTSGSKKSDGFSDVKIQALRSLDALVACLGSNLIAYSSLVIKLTMQTLRWSSENPSQEASAVRCAAYGSLCAWLRALRLLRSPRAAWEDELAAHVLRDVTPGSKLVQLTINQQPTKKLSRKARKKLAKTMLKESAIAQHMPGEKNKIHVGEDTNDEVALAALSCAETFLIVCGRFLKPTTHKVLQERLVRECYRESNSSCLLLALLRALEACRKTTPTTVPPPTQYCLHLYSQRLNHHHSEISSFCSQALLDIRLHLHCSPPSLSFVIETQQDMENTHQKRKTVSEKNRAALEALLGPGRMPTQNDEDEIIAIPDEPSPKKPRIEEEPDKISVSSTSVSSIEVSDDDSDEDDVQEVEVTVEINNMKENEVNKLNEKLDEVNKELYKVNQLGNIQKETEKDEDSNMQVAEITEVSKETNDTILGQETDLEEQIKPIKEHNSDRSIFEATTQLPLNMSNDTIDGEERPHSLEVGYDYPNNRSETLTVLEKPDEEYLPSTNDTDDIQITCGQQVKSSQDEVDKKSGDIDKKMDASEEPQINGIEKPIENGHLEVVDNTANELTKVLAKSDGISVEDMLADFVDEVNEDVTA